MNRVLEPWISVATALLMFSIEEKLRGQKKRHQTKAHPRNNAPQCSQATKRALEECLQMALKQRHRKSSDRC
jgi:hypothetical protein